MKHKLEQYVISVWYKKYHGLAWLLWPLSLLFLIVVFLRRKYYQYFPGASKKISVPVIVVGNITVGGTGKTPLVIALVKYLEAQGKRVAVIKRAYRASAKMPTLVTSASKVKQVGDEAFEIHLAGVSNIIVGDDRVACAKYALKHCQPDVIISDDGLQHYRLQRDVEIAVIDGKRGLGNGFCLPAGPLREPKQRLSSVDLIVSNGEPVFDKSYSMVLNPLRLVNVADMNKVLSLEVALKHDWVALSGIGHPERFFEQLKTLQFRLKTCHSFPDHYAFMQEDIDLAPDDWVIMTRKDAVKCQSFADDRHWYLDYAAHVSPDFFERLMSLIQ